MVPRLLTRTHYQVDEPAFLRVLVLQCTSPIRSEYRERVGNRLVAEGIEGINKGSAGYLIDLGRATGLINKNNIWTERGLLLNLLSQTGERTNRMDLTLREKVFFFRVLLDTDGAAIIYFLRELRRRKQLPENESDWNAIANDLFIWTFKSYYILTSDVTTRIRLRELIQQRKANPFSGTHSGDHQCLLHLQSLYRLGLIAKPRGDNSRIFIRASDAASAPADYLLKKLNGVEALETAVNCQKWMEFASVIFSPSSTREVHQADESDEVFHHEIFEAYRRLGVTGIPLCPLRTLVEKVQIEEIVRGQNAQSYEARIEGLKRLQRKHPRQVHFHVDRIGRPAYLKLDRNLIGT